jgi:hypothetical protein
MTHPRAAARTQTLSERLHVRVWCCTRPAQPHLERWHGCLRKSCTGRSQSRLCGSSPPRHNSLVWRVPWVGFGSCCDRSCGSGWDLLRDRGRKGPGQVRRLAQGSQQERSLVYSTAFELSGRVQAYRSHVNAGPPALAGCDITLRGTAGPGAQRKARTPASALPGLAACDKVKRASLPLAQRSRWRACVLHQDACRHAALSTDFACNSLQACLRMVHAAAWCAHTGCWTPMVTAGTRASKQRPPRAE